MLYYYIFILLTVVELVLFIMLLSFFRRLRRSEELLGELHSSQTAILDKLQLNASLEDELLRSFYQRQQELSRLDMQLEAKAENLRKLLEQAEEVSRSPQFLRELIINGYAKGRSSLELAKNTGLSTDEVELILAQASLK